jgi:hypothetical protein
MQSAAILLLAAVVASAVKTSHGSLAIEECGAGDTPVLFIHGNSFREASFGINASSNLCMARRLLRRLGYEVTSSGKSRRYWRYDSVAFSNRPMRSAR